MSEHTGEFWTVDLGEGDWPLIFSEDGILVADPMPKDEAAEGNPKKIIANAHLIAASPEMKASLKNCVGMLRAFGDNSGCIEEAEAILAKIEGE